MTDASASGLPSAPNKLGILVELQQRIAVTESKIQVADEEYEQAATQLRQQFKQKILLITWTVLAEEILLFLTDFRDSERLLSGEIALLDYRPPAPRTL